MEMPKDKLEEYSTKYNRSKGQCEFLYQLLKGDMNLYVELEDAIKYLMLFYCPSDYYECLYVLTHYRTRKHVDKICESAMAKNSYCRLKGTNIFGIIKSELNATKDFPEQWGIYWFSSVDGEEYGVEHRKIKGWLPYWCPKTEIEIIPNKKFREKHWNVRTIFKHYDK